MESEVVSTLLIRKYNKPVPRYTSYPTVPNWNETLGEEEWRRNFSSRYSEQNHINGISLYIHLPFCESLCTYCGCNKKITTNHKVEDEYLQALEKEWSLYRKMMKQTPVIREVHLGGGTPTFFSPANLQRMISFLCKGVIIHPQHEFSIEGHPNNTTPEHLKELYKAGFRRISYGVQDLDPEVQRVINRVQPFSKLGEATLHAREAGFTSVNFDLIYGLPLQTLESVKNTINQVIELKPDRIAFYSYAHVPWTSKAQRLFDASHLPSAEEKLHLYLRGRELLMKHGYYDVGMDHFSLPGDELYKAWTAGKMHRNFMGYTTQHSGLLLGLGVSGISDTGNAYAQNEKTIHNYYARVEKGMLPVKKGYVLNEEDLAFKKYILDISCKGYTSFRQKDLSLLKEYSFPVLADLAKDELLTWDEEGLELTPRGHYFIRNICSAFDLYLQRAGTMAGRQVFSQAI